MIGPDGTRYARRSRSSGCIGQGSLRPGRLPPAPAAAEAGEGASVLCGSSGCFTVADSASLRRRRAPSKRARSTARSSASSSVLNQATAEGSGAVSRISNCPSSRPTDPKKPGRVPGPGPGRHFTASLRGESLADTNVSLTIRTLTVMCLSVQEGFVQASVVRSSPSRPPPFPVRQRSIGPSSVSCRVSFGFPLSVIVRKSTPREPTMDRERSRPK